MHGARIVEFGIATKVHVQPLSQRRQSLNPLRAVEKCRGSGDDQIQSRKASAVDLVHELAKGIQCLVPNIAAHALESFHLIQHHHHSRAPRIPEDDKQPLQESKGCEMVHVSLDARGAFRFHADIRLPPKPCDESIRYRGLTSGLSVAIAPERHAESRSHAVDGCEALLQQFIGLLQQPFGSGCGCVSAGQDILLEREEPAINQRPKYSVVTLGRAQALDQSAIDRFQPMQRSLCFTDLHLSRHETGALRPILQPTSQESFAAAIFTADGFENASSRSDLLQFLVECAFKPIHPHSERLQPPAGNCATPEGVQNFDSSLWADHNVFTLFQIVS